MSSQLSHKDFLAFLVPVWENPVIQEVRCARSCILLFCRYFCLTLAPFHNLTSLFPVAHIHGFPKFFFSYCLCLQLLPDWILPTLLLIEPQLVKLAIRSNTLYHFLILLQQFRVRAGGVWIYSDAARSQISLNRVRSLPFGFLISLAESSNGDDTTLFPTYLKTEMCIKVLISATLTSWRN